MEPLRVGVLASGRGSNLQAILDASRAGDLDVRVTVVLSDHADALALARARDAGVPTIFVDPDERSREDHEAEVAAHLDDYQVDLVCLAGYMRILTPLLVERYAGRMVNIHPSLLPAFPGLHAQRQALEAGVRIAGCTTHLVTTEVDGGPILLQAAVPVLPDDDEDALAARILEEEHRIYPRTLQLFAEDRVHVEDGRARIDGAEELGDLPTLRWAP